MTLTSYGSVGAMLRVLAVDDEEPALEELAYLLRQDRRVEHVTTACDGVAALQDMVQMIGRRRAARRDLPGHPDARPRRARPGPARRRVPQPAQAGVRHRPRRVRGAGLRAGGRRLPAEAGPGRAAGGGGAPAGGGRLAPAAEPGHGRRDPGRARRAHPVRARSRRSGSPRRKGDYVRLHTDDGSYLVRMSLAALERRWAEAGSSGCTAARWSPPAMSASSGSRAAGSRSTVGTEVLQVSRRHSRQVREQLVRQHRGVIS